MTVADAVARLLPLLLTGTPHPDYARTVELATTYRRLATGDVAALMRPMARRENAAQFAQRVAWTIETVSSSWNELRTPFYQVARLRGGTVTKRFDYAEAVPTTEAQRRAQRLEALTDTYYNRKPIENYLAEVLSKSVCMSDPNAWLLTDFAPFDFRTQVAQPYPLLLPCEAAVDFTRQAGVVSSFTGRFSIPQSQSAYRYTCYLENEAVDCWPVLWEGDKPTYTMPQGYVVAGIVYEIGANGQQGKAVYQYRILNHKAGRVPAMPVGYVIDEVTEGRTFVSPLHPALPYLRGMLKVGSENDIVMSQMAFPIKAAYVKDCPGMGRIGDVIHTCQGGVDLKSDTGKCGLCGGEGTLPVPITAAETVTLPFPEIGEELKVKPADMVAYIAPPVEAPELQLRYLETRRLLAKQAVFGVEQAARVAGSDTATQQRIKLDAELTALAPFADQHVSLYVHAASVSAGYADVADQLTVVYELPADLERLSVDDLYDQRRRAVIAGAPASSLAVIDRRITMKELADDPAELNRYIVQCRFVTFLGYSDMWVTQQSTLGYISAEDRVARTHTDIIFDELELDEPGFYQLAYRAQVPLVAAKIKDIIGRLPAAGSTSSTFRPTSFTAPTVAPAAPAVPVSA
jgi:hypothetical protein